MAHRYAPTVLPDGFGVTVYGPDAGLLAGAVALLMDIQSGRVPPAAARRYEPSPRLAVLRDVLAEAAKQQEAAKHRDLAQVSQPKPQTTPVFLSPENLGGSSATVMVTVADAAADLGVSVQYARGLCRAGKLDAVQGPRSTWTVSAPSIAAFKSAQRRRNPGHGQNYRDTAGDAASAA